MPQQPWLHEFEIAVDGPSTVLSTHDGRIGSPGSGWFVDDRRVLSVLELELDGEQATAVAADTVGRSSQFWGVARHLGDRTPDPTVEVHRTRGLRDAVLTEEVRIVSRATEPVRTSVRLLIGGDGAELGTVKAGQADDLPLLPPSESEDSDVGAVATWADDRHRTEVASEPAPAAVRHTPKGVHLEWSVELQPQTTWAATVTVRAQRVAATTFDSRPGSDLVDLSRIGLAGDPLWDDLIRTNLQDLQHLLQTDPEAPADVFAGAGSPWYLTLFGRDSIWAARFLLPYAPELALGTLRTLARRQATADDEETAAEVGKILHEVRRGAFAHGDFALPPVYYGTVDATPLWICLLHEAWVWGLGEDEVRELLPTLRAALGWMERMVDEADDGFLRYVDTTGRGLANQGWKDSGDSMRRADGTVAPAPIALLEAQGYAVQAARGAAELFGVLGEPEDERRRWRDWAASLAERVRQRFWVGEGAGAYLAMALDADGQAVDGVGSNMGHVLDTGLLTDEEVARVVQRLTAPDMLRQFGIATLSADNPAYNPIGYHTGSVWTHDTAITLRGLVATGHREEADAVLTALRRLSTSLHHRFPELTAGDPVGDRPVPYPASCRPQAWSAATAAVMATALAGLRVGTDGTLDVEPSALLPGGGELHGVRFAGEERVVRIPAQRRA